LPSTVETMRSTAEPKRRADQPLPSCTRTYRNSLSSATICVAISIKCHIADEGWEE